LAADSAALAVVAVRPHLVFGPGDTQLVARLVDRASRRRLPVIGPGAALLDITYVTNAVDALVAALDRCDEVHGQALVVTNGEPRPIRDLLYAICDAAGVPRPSRRVPVRLAKSAGSIVQAAWDLHDHLRPDRPANDPPLTRFVVEQMSTAHWFDQRHTRRALHWEPRISLDEGFEELGRYYRN
jgi:nucleoside-diphosphate-sugar epimerase